MGFLKVKKFEVLFEFEVRQGRRPFVYRGVCAPDGSYRIDKKGRTAKVFHAVVWCSNLASLNRARKIIEDEK